VHDAGVSQVMMQGQPGDDAGVSQVMMQGQPGDDAEGEGLCAPQAVPFEVHARFVDANKRKQKQSMGKKGIGLGASQGTSG
jgi:hypothetical protein